MIPASTIVSVRALRSESFHPSAAPLFADEFAIRKLRRIDPRLVAEPPCSG
jgi:hypothetical protein